MLKKLVPILAAALLLAATAGSASAEITLAGNKADAKSWSFSTDGFLNTFLVYQDSEAQPAHTAGVGTIVAGQSSTIRTGLLPGLIAFNVKAPTTNGVDITARLGFYPQIQAGGTRSTFSSQIDTRELWFAADGSFGQVLAGKALNLFQGKSILTDMTLFGVGDPGDPKSRGTTLGHIGSGYLYAEFSPNIRYTTPDLGGLKVAVSLVDPSQIAGSGVAAKVTKSPAVEAEISYATKFTGGTAQAWVNGLYQHAGFDAATVAAHPGVESVDAEGVSGGVQVGFAGAELQATGFTGKGLGSLLLLDTDSLDAAGKARTSSGFLVQGTYKVTANTKLGVNYGMNIMDETAADQAERLAGTAELKNRGALTLGVYQNITPSWQVMAEYTRSTNTWFNDAEQKANAFSVGTFFFF
jgi:hypothetical protein